jgi:hypothetical protein
MVYYEDKQGKCGPSLKIAEFICLIKHKFITNSTLELHWVDVCGILIIKHKAPLSHRHCTLPQDCPVKPTRVSENRNGHSYMTGSEAPTEAATAKGAAVDADEEVLPDNEAVPENQTHTLERL